MDVSWKHHVLFLSRGQLAESGHIHGIKLMSSKEGGTSVLPVRNGFLACPSSQAMPKSGLGTYWLVQTKSVLGPISPTGFLGCSDPIMFASTYLASYLTSGNLGQLFLCLMTSRNMQPPIHPHFEMPVSRTVQGSSCLLADMVLAEQLT